MEKINFNKWVPVEPLKNNRFVIETTGANIPEYLFRNYHLYNDSDNMILETSFMETVDFTFNPKEFFNITDIIIKYLDPVGNIVNELIFEVKASHFEKNGDYGDDGLQLNNMKFIVNPKKIKQKYKNTIDKNEVY
jgi:hypothetical protein